MTDYLNSVLICLEVTKFKVNISILKNLFVFCNPILYFCINRLIKNGLLVYKQRYNKLLYQSRRLLTSHNFIQLDYFVNSIIVSNVVSALLKLSITIYQKKQVDPIHRKTISCLFKSRAEYRDNKLITTSSTQHKCRVKHNGSQNPQFRAS